MIARCKRNHPGNRSFRMCQNSLPRPWRRSVLVAILVLHVVAGSPLRAVRAELRDEVKSAANHIPRTVSLTWEGVPLHRAIGRLEAASGVSVFLDCRIDPGSRVTFQAIDATGREVVSQLAAQLGLSATHVNNLLYLGPPEICGDLRTLVEQRLMEVANLPPGLRESFEPIASTDWLKLARPRAVVESMIADAGLRIRGQELIPHDLWRSGGLPPMQLAHRLTVLLAGFDLTFRLPSAGNEISIVPIKRPVVLVRTYQIPRGKEPLFSNIAQLSQAATVSRTSDKFQLSGRLEDHERLAELLEPTVKHSRQRKVVREHQVFTLRVRDQPLRPLVVQLARQLSLELNWNEEQIKLAGISLDQRVTFAVNSVKLDALLEAIFGPVGLAADVKDGRLHVIAKSE